MDQASLKNSDVLVLTGLTQIPTANPDGMVGEFCSNLGRLALLCPELVTHLDLFFSSLFLKYSLSLPLRSHTLWSVCLSVCLSPLLPASLPSFLPLCGTGD